MRHNIPVFDLTARAAADEKEERLRPMHTEPGVRNREEEPRAESKGV